MTIGILKADNVRQGLVHEFGEYPGMFAALMRQVDPKLNFVTYEVQQMEYPKNLDEVDAYLITGSSHSVYEDLEWIHRLGAFIQQLDHANKKIIGICFGHQLVAHFLGGKTAASPKGWGIGIYAVQFTEAGQSFIADKKGYQLISSHKDQVLIPATDFEVLAGSDFCPNAMCKKGNQVLTMQAHPEFSPDYFRHLVSLRSHLFKKSHYAEALESLEQKETDRLLVARCMIDFLKK